MLVVRLGIAIAIEAGIGLVLVIWARPLSARYNAWTAGLRERHANINPPPTPEMRALNTKIMTAILRVAGVLLIGFATSVLLGQFRH